ncbi:MAG: hypothetical protein R3F55_21275 [Alphaproteobacteria bacterium]
MKKATIGYTPRFRPSPVSAWVHVPTGPVPAWRDAGAYSPPLPGPVGGRGWPVLDVEVDGVALTFSSLAELDHVIDVLSRNPLPTTRQLSAARGNGAGPNGHWLSRLPAKAKPARFRAVLVARLRRARDAYAAVARVAKA